MRKAFIEMAYCQPQVQSTFPTVRAASQFRRREESPLSWRCVCLSFPWSFGLTLGVRGHTFWSIWHLNGPWTSVWFWSLENH